MWRCGATRAERLCFQNLPKGDFMNAMNTIRPGQASGMPTMADLVESGRYRAQG